MLRFVPRVATRRRPLHRVHGPGRPQGHDAAGVQAVLEGALALESRDAGALSIVLEAITHRLAEYITVRLGISTIGIGAEPSTSMEALAWDDMMVCWHGKGGQVCATVRGR